MADTLYVMGYVPPPSGREVNDFLGVTTQRSIAIAWLVTGSGGERCVWVVQEGVVTWQRRITDPGELE